MLTGGCHCGAVRYRMATTRVRHSLCHCEDCRRTCGAPAVSWGLIPLGEIEIEGATKSYASSEHARRLFCGECGTSLFYVNEVIFPGQIDVQTATLDEPGRLPLEAQVQTAERIGWMEDLDVLPNYRRYPPPGPV